MTYQGERRAGPFPLALLLSGGAHRGSMLYEEFLSPLRGFGETENPSFPPYPRGNTISANAPPPSRFTTRTVPPCDFATSRTRFNPNPVLFLPVSGRPRE